MKTVFHLTLTIFIMSVANIKAESITNQTFVNQIKALQSLTEKEGRKLLSEVGQNQREIQDALLDQLNSTNVTIKCYAAYLLGEYRCPRAVNSLAQVITLHENIVRPNASEWFWDLYPAMEALIRIGSPSIPAVIRNLAESEDAKVRQLSLQVLYRIEADKDIVQLRLQKALAAEKDSKKQASLQAALKELTENSFRN